MTTINVERELRLFAAACAEHLLQLRAFEARYTAFPAHSAFPSFPSFPAHSAYSAYSAYSAAASERAWQLRAMRLADAALS